MNYGSEPADQVVRYSLEGAEFALRISGTAAKNFFIFAQAVLHDSKKTHGKTHLIRLLKEQKPLKFFTVDKDRMHDFARAAKAHPKGEILRKTGNLLKAKGYEVIVFDLINPAASFCYNPFVYVHDDREVLTLIENLIQNTTPPHAQSNDPFWTKSETALLQALMLYLLHEAPPEEQNFSMVMEMIAAAEVHEDDDNYQSPLDILFERLEMREPDSIACKQYRIFKQAAGVVSLKRLLNQSNLKSWSSKMIKKSLEAYFFTLKNKIVFCKKQFQNMSVFCFVSTEIV